MGAVVPRRTASYRRNELARSQLFCGPRVRLQAGHPQSVLKLSFRTEPLAPDAEMRESLMEPHLECPVVCDRQEQAKLLVVSSLQILEPRERIAGVANLDRPTVA